jgi:hypothetical protein
MLEGRSLSKNLDEASQDSYETKMEGHAKSFLRRNLTYEKIELYGMKNYNVPTKDEQQRKSFAFKYVEPINKKNRESVFEENAKKYANLPAPSKYQKVQNWCEMDKSYKGKFSKYKNVNMFSSLISLEKTKPGPSKYVNDNWDNFSYKISKGAVQKDKRSGVFEEIKFHESKKPNPMTYDAIDISKLRPN